MVANNIAKLWFSLLFLELNFASPSLVTCTRLTTFGILKKASLRCQIMEKYSAKVVRILLSTETVLEPSLFSLNTHAPVMAKLGSLSKPQFFLFKHFCNLVVVF